MPPKGEDKKEEYFPILKIIQAKQKALYVKFKSLSIQLYLEIIRKL